MRHWADLSDDDKQLLATILKPGECIRRPKRTWIPPEAIIEFYRETLAVEVVGWRAIILTAKRYRLSTETVRKIVSRFSTS